MEAQPSSLRRALGRWDLTAIGINQVIGGGIFLVPAPIAAQIGNWSPLGFVLAGFATLLIALCYAEAGSRFRETGGAYLYTRAAFGRLVGFEVGWMQWFVRVSSQAAIVNGIAIAAGFYWPAAKESWRQILIVSTITLLIGYGHVRGIRQSAWAVNFFTFGKLIPLCVFLGAGLFLIDWRRLSPLPAVSPDQALTAGLLMFFAYGGFETIGVVSGEAKDPARHLLFAFGLTIVSVTVIMSGLQTICTAALPDLARSATPLADSAKALLGWAGAALLGAGSVISMLGNNVGSSLSASRTLFAIAENGDVPAFLARIHPTYRTPIHAIWFSTAVALLLAITGSFAMLAAVSAVARLVTYAGVSAATLALRQPRFPQAAFLLPLGATIPVVATLVSLSIFAGATGPQLTAGGAALGAGAVLYFCNRWLAPRNVTDR